MFLHSFQTELADHINRNTTPEDQNLPRRWMKSSMELVTLKTHKNANRQRWELMDQSELPNFHQKPHQLTKPPPEIKTYHLKTFDTLERMHSSRQTLFCLWTGEVGHYFRTIYSSLPPPLRSSLWTYSLLLVSHSPDGPLLREFTLDFQPPLDAPSFITLLNNLSWARRDPSWSPPYFSKIEAAHKRWVDGMKGDKQTVREAKMPFFDALRAMCLHANEVYVILACCEMLMVWARVLRKVGDPRRAPPNSAVFPPLHKIPSPTLTNKSSRRPPRNPFQS